MATSTSAYGTGSSTSRAGNSSTVVPTPVPTPRLPEGATPGVNTNSWDGVRVTAYTSLLAGAVMLTLFECLRGRRNRMCRSLYRQRHSLRFRKINIRLKRIVVPTYPRGFLRWWTCTRNVDDSEFYRQVGMDGYVTLRFIKLCKRLCFFAALVGGIVLIPIYFTGENDETGAARLSVANIANGDRALWAPVVFAWLFTLYFLHSLHRELLTYSDLRNDWLAGEDVARDPQTNYTMRVERIPRAFRSPAILQKFFSTLFPGQIHSATVCLGLNDLRSLTMQRYNALQNLERAIIRKEAFHERPMTRTSWLGPRVDAIDYYGTKLAELNQKLRPKQEQKLEAAKTVERLKRKELKKMGASLENMPLYFVDQLNRGESDEEDGNSRVSWLERLEGDSGYHVQGTSRTIAQRQQPEQHRERDSGIGSTELSDRERQLSGNSEASRVGGAGRVSDQWRVGGGGGSAVGGAGIGRVKGRERDRERDVSLEEVKEGGEKHTRVLSPVVEETHRGERHGSLSSLLSRPRSNTRPRLSSFNTHSTGGAIARQGSWRQRVSRKDAERDADAQDKQRLLDAEELVIEQGEVYIRHHLDRIRQTSNLHQTLGAGAVGAGSVAAPRASAMVHPVCDRDGSGDEYNGFSSRRNSRGSSRGSLPGQCCIHAGGGSGCSQCDVLEAMDAYSRNPQSSAAAAAAAREGHDPCTLDDSHRLSSPLTPQGSMASSSFFSVSSPARHWMRFGEDLGCADRASLVAESNATAHYGVARGARRSLVTSSNTGGGGGSTGAGMRVGGVGAGAREGAGGVGIGEGDGERGDGSGREGASMGPAGSRVAVRDPTSPFYTAPVSDENRAAAIARLSSSFSVVSSGSVDTSKGEDARDSTESLRVSGVETGTGTGTTSDVPDSDSGEGGAEATGLDGGVGARARVERATEDIARRRAATGEEQADAFSRRRRSRSVPLSHETAFVAGAAAAVRAGTKLKSNLVNGFQARSRSEKHVGASKDGVVEHTLPRRRSFSVSSGTDYDETSLSGGGAPAALIMESDESSSPGSTTSFASRASAGITPVPPAAALHRRKPRLRPSKLSVEDVDDDHEEEEDVEAGKPETDLQDVTRHDMEDFPRNGIQKGLQDVGRPGPSANGGGLEHGAIAATTLEVAPVTAAGVLSGAAHEDDAAQTGSRASGVRPFASLFGLPRQRERETLLRSVHGDPASGATGRRRSDSSMYSTADREERYPMRMGRPKAPWENDVSDDESRPPVENGFKYGTRHRRRRRSGPSDGDPSREKKKGIPGLKGIKCRVERHVRKTGKYMKEVVKDKVADAAHNIKRGVNEGVNEVTEAVKGYTSVELHVGTHRFNRRQVLTAAGSMSGTGFVTFKCLAGRACAVQTLVTNRPEVFNLSPAPEPRDIVWKNVTNHVIYVRNRHRLVNASLVVCIIFWSVVVSGIQGLSEVDNLAVVLPFVTDLAEDNEYATSIVTAYIPVILLLVLINTLYFILKAVALHLEGYKTYSEVERAVMGRYFFFQLANVFVTIGAGSIKDALSDIIDSPKAILTLLGETMPTVAVYFMNLIIVKMVTGLLLELCFGGRPLKFWRILVAELFTDVGLRTKAGRTRGAFEPSEPWYGRFFADFLLVLLIVFTFQVIAPFVAVLGLLYFVFAEVIYKYQLMHCYWPMYESGGIFFHKLFGQMVIGAMAGQFTLLGYMTLRGGNNKQWPFVIPLPFMVLYLSSRWKREARRAALSLSLDKAVLQDRQNEIEVGQGKKEPAWCSFSPTTYMQPSLLPSDPDAAFGPAEGCQDDSDVDADGPLELDDRGNVVSGNYLKGKRRRAADMRRRDSPRPSRFSLFPFLSSNSEETGLSKRGHGETMARSISGSTGLPSTATTSIRPKLPESDEEGDLMA